jgi:hypothetical protein
MLSGNAGRNAQIGYLESIRSLKFKAELALGFKLSAFGCI